MKSQLIKLTTAFLTIMGVGALIAAQQTSAEPKAADTGDKFVYADFETINDNRPVSTHGGLVQLFTYQENPGQSGVMKGIAGLNPPAPELVHLKKDDPNKAATFEYQIRVPNAYAGVTLEIHGQADKDGKTIADDVSNFKNLTVQIYATGTSYMRVEFLSKGQGINLFTGFPQTTFKVTPGFNTYKLPLKALAQPTWAQDRVNPKDVLKKLTSVNISVYCEGSCTPLQGVVIVDNVIFQN